MCSQLLFLAMTVCFQPHFGPTDLLLPSKFHKPNRRVVEGVSLELGEDGCCEIPAAGIKLTQRAACSLLRSKEQQRGRASKELAAGITLTADVLAPVCLSFQSVCSQAPNC